MNNYRWILAGVLLAGLSGCYKPYDHRVNVAQGVRGDTIGNNIITRPIGNFVSVVIGEGIQIDNIVERRSPEGFLEVQVSGYNNSVKKKIFDYRAEWLDSDGLAMDSVMTKWRSVSAMPKSSFSFKAIAPNAKAADYRINTRQNKITN
jgi:uncharacterized protein YcfL